MTIRSHNPTAGLFSQINFLITHLETHPDKTFHVDWHSGLPYHSEAGVNLFDLLFVNPEPLPSDDPPTTRWPHQRYTGPNAAELYRGRKAWRWRLHEQWQRLSLVPDIIETVETFCRSWNEPVTAVHVRNARIGSECPGGIAPTLESYADLLAGFDGAVYLSTDNDEAADFFHGVLGHRLLVRDIRRSPDMRTEFHLSGGARAGDARDCLIDALIMAHCDHLIHSVSNIATAVLYINPVMSHTFLTHGGFLRRSKNLCREENTAIAAAMATPRPAGLAKLEHSHWRDWIIIDQSGAFMRHGERDAGLVCHASSGRLTLRWQDWDPEEFVLLDVPPRQESHDHEFNRRNTLVYQLKPRLGAITVRLKEGLGNQMFQYACGFAMARWFDVPLRVEKDAQTIRAYGLHHFGIVLSSPHPGPSDWIEFNETYDEGSVCRLREMVAEARTPHVVLDGYFQNEGFFSNVEAAIRRKFAIHPEPPFDEEGRILVCVHVRRGDYVGSDAHLLCGPAYYSRAVDWMRRRVANPRFLVFCENPADCRNVIGEADDVTIMPRMGQMQTFRAMLGCRAFIIANSTFSWWAAWLSHSQQVICPDRFLRDREWHVCPERWTHLPVC